MLIGGDIYFDLLKVIEMGIIIGCVLMKHLTVYFGVGRLCSSSLYQYGGVGIYSMIFHMYHTHTTTIKINAWGVMEA